jgi:large repetitive protein
MARTRRHPAVRAAVLTSAVAALAAVPAIAQADPTVSITTPTDGAFFGLNQAVTPLFTCTATAGQGITSCVGPAALDTSTEGPHTFTVTATDDLPSAATATGSYFVDGTAPTVGITAPAAGAAFYAGQAVTPAATCGDAASGVATCAIPAALDTAAPGPHTLTVTATDNVGNAGSASLPYTIFASPITLSAPPAVVDQGSIPPLAAFGCDATAPGAPPILSCTATQTVAGVTTPLVAGAPLDTLTAGAHTITVSAASAAGPLPPVVASYLVQDASAPSAPTDLSPASGSSVGQAAPLLAWSPATDGTGTGIGAYQVTIDGAAYLVPGGQTQFQVPAPLPDGAHHWSVVALDLAPVPNASAPAEADLTIDTVAPDAPAVAPPAPSAGLATGAFSWAGESGGDYLWQVIGPAGAVVLSGTSTDPAVDVRGLLDAGTYAFRVRQRDAAGNLSPWSAPAPFGVSASADGGPSDTGGGGGTPSATPDPPKSGPVTVVPPASSGTRKPGTKVAKLPKPTVRNARLLRPAAGTRLHGSVVLHWKRGAAGVKLYNLQVFVGRTKVLSRFPKGTSLQLPRTILRAGTRYQWRIWPYYGPKRGYARQPLGMSYFDLTR